MRNYLFALAIVSARQARRIVFGRMPVIQAPKLGLRIMRYELADFE
jgi:hypothetical protein